MIEYPEMRDGIIDALKALADPAYQRRVWVERDLPHPGYYDELDANIALLFDDTVIAEDPYAHIGRTLRNEKEARAVKDLIDVLEPLYDSLPPGVDDAAVIALPEWKAVVTAARQAVHVLSEPDVPLATE